MVSEAVGRRCLRDDRFAVRYDAEARTKYAFGRSSRSIWAVLAGKLQNGPLVVKPRAQQSWRGLHDRLIQTRHSAPRGSMSKYLRCDGCGEILDRLPVGITPRYARKDGLF